jgi:hypothetical protein
MSVKTRQSLSSVDLVVCMGNIIDFKFLKIFMNFVDFWPLGNINLESDCSEKLGNQEKVCKRNFVSNAVGTFAAFKKLDSVQILTTIHRVEISRRKCFFNFLNILRSSSKS